MSKAEKFIEDCTRNCSNYTGLINKRTCEGYYVPWLTPYQARRAVEIAREEVIEKAIGWIGEIYNYHEIMCYSDSREPSLEKLTEWFKNYIKEGGKDE
jgi:hypothetical protein